MASQISPGIILRERDITTATIVGAQTLTAAFATTFTKGPVDRITAINSQREFIDTFGKPTEQNAEDWFVASEFLNYGGRLAVVRALTEDLRTANSEGTTSLVVKNELDWLGNNYSELFAARTPGKWGNSAKVVVVDRGADQYVELASAPDTVSTDVGTYWTFTNGKAGYVLSWDADLNRAAIVLDNPDVPLTVSDKLNDGDEISATTNVSVTTQSIRVPGTYTGLVSVEDLAAGKTNPAQFTITVADASDGRLKTDAALSGTTGGGGSLAGPIDTVSAFAGGGGSLLGGVGSVSFTGGDGDALGTEVSAVYTGVASTSGDGGSGATFTVTRGSSAEVLDVTVDAGGINYNVGDTLTIAAADIGALSDPTITDITLTVVDTNPVLANQTYTAVSSTSAQGGSGATFTVVRDASGNVSSVTLVASGVAYEVGDNITIPAANIGLAANPTVTAVTLTVTAVDNIANASYFTVPSTTDGAGTGATFTVTRGSNGLVSDVVVVGQGEGYSAGDVITIAAANIGLSNDPSVVDLEITLISGDIAVLGGAVTVTRTSDGDGYSVNDLLTFDAADAGFNGSDVVIRVTGLDADRDIAKVYDWYTNTTISVGALTVPLNALGVRPGTSQYAAERNIRYDEVTVAVIDVDGRISGTVGNVVERKNSLSKLSDGRSTENGIVFYKTIINDQSDYVFIGSTTPESVLDQSVDAQFIDWEQDSDAIVESGGGTTFAICGVQEYQLTAGADDYDYTVAEITDAYDLFSSSDETELDFLLMGGSMSDEDGTKTKASKVVQIAAARKDCIAFVSPHKGNQIGSGGVTLSAAQQKENTINFFRTLTSTSYAVFDSGYKYLYDRFNDRYRYVPCNGDVAGLCVATSASLADWYSPAGVIRGSLRNAIKLAYNPSAADRDDLYTNRINPITTLPGTGITLFGDKTALASTSAFDRINVRRLFLNIEKRVERLASGVLFEQNDVLTRSSFSSAVNSYLAEVQAGRGVTDFLVVCDETNNTPDVIDRNEFVAEIFVKAARSINFVNITFTATKTGVSFAEVVGR